MRKMLKLANKMTISCKIIINQIKPQKWIFKNGKISTKQIIWQNSIDYFFKNCIIQTSGVSPWHLYYPPEIGIISLASGVNPWHLYYPTNIWSTLHSGFETKYCLYEMNFKIFKNNFKCFYAVLMAQIHQEITLRAFLLSKPSKTPI